MVTTGKTVTKERTPVNINRQCPRRKYLFQSQPIRQQAFLFLTDCSKNKLPAVSKHDQRDGLTVRMNKAHGKHSSFEACKLALEFLFNYSQTCAFQLSERIVGFQRALLQLLPSSDTI